MSRTNLSKAGEGYLAQLKQVVLSHGLSLAEE